MKSSIMRLFGALGILSILFFTGCKTNDPEPETGWTDPLAKESHDNVINLQDQVGNQFDDWLTSMDSLEALNQARQAFAGSEYVSTATINSQGIAVQYANGMRGGLFLRPKDDIGEVGDLPLVISPETIPDDGLKSLVNKREMILINPHYFERSYFTDQVFSITSGKLRKVGMELTTFYKNQEATVDRFTELSGYGIIQLYSHGCAWPKQENITDVYLLTGETVNNATSAKYWDELTKGNIPVMKTGGSNKYFVNPQFIMDNNDFSKDTIMFYGGFCYSFLGNWPDIVETFADGAYLGFDWSVYTHKNANWSVNSIALMCDTLLDEPMTLEGWFQNTDVEKSYWNERDQRTVEIHYTGDGNLKLWDNISVSLVPLSANGAPVYNVGEAGVEYPFRCEVVTNISPLEYVWDIGDGSSPATTQGNEVYITWANNGDYELSVKVKNKTNGKIIGSTKVDVSIGENNDNVTEFVTSCTSAGCTFKAEIMYSPPGGWGNSINPNSVELVWSGLSFSGTYEENNSGIYTKSTISGSLSSDGQKISFEAREEIEEPYLDAQSDFTITVVDYPLSIIFEGSENIDPYAAYGSPYSGNVDVQQYVSSFEGYQTSQGVTHTVSGVNWDNVSMLCFMFVKATVSKVSEHPSVQDLQPSSK